MLCQWWILVRVPGRRRRDRGEACRVDRAVGKPASGEEEPKAWVLISPRAVPERWRHRAVDLALIPLLPEEASRVLAGDGAHPVLNPEDAAFARLLVRGLTISAIADELEMSVRGVQRRVGRLRERFGTETTAQLRGLFADRGFGSS